MSSRNWTLLTLFLTLALAGGFVRLNVQLDIFGVFGDPHGKLLPIYDSERSGKYLLSLHYVPSNFDAILIGTSVTGNWNTSGIESFHTYNESTDGGNISEEKLLAEQVLLSPGLKAAICLIHPYMTDTHGVNTEEMTPRSYREALGSTTLLRTYKRMFTTSTGREKLLWDAYGSEYTDAPLVLNPTLRRIMAPGTEVHVDEVAFEEYRTLVGELRAHNVKIIALMAPTMEDLLEPKRAAMDRYQERMRTLFVPGDLVIDFNAPEYAELRRDRTNYQEGVHFSRKGAAAMVKLLNQRIVAASAP